METQIQQILWLQTLIAADQHANSRLLLALAEHQASQDAAVRVAAQQLEASSDALQKALTEQAGATAPANPVFHRED